MNKVAEVTLRDCAHEPIHIPGLIQPHGALLAFDAQAVLVFHSANADAMLGTACKPGAGVAQLGLPDVATAKILQWLGDRSGDFESIELHSAGRDFDVIGHRNVDGLLIAEFEMNTQSALSVASFALIAHKAIERLRRLRNVDELLGLGAAEVRKITGFDRVMAYRFLHDDSGEVVRESRRADLESWEGRRYPSSDIPVQARRLYVLNTLRLIARVDAGTVHLIGATADAAARPLDMSSCCLRSVSPIHIEYLTNMGVAASLSISIVIDGKLWGMIACHHGSPRHVPYGIRLACEVLGQMLSLTIASLESAAVADRVARSTETLARIGVRARAAEDLLSGVAFERPNPSDLVDADVTLCLWGGKAKVCQGDLAAQSIGALAEILEATQEDTLAWSEAAAAHPALAAAIAPYCGVLAVCFDLGHRGWVVWLRTEQIENVRWAGKPEKTVTIGPNGPRLTPRGSFAEWREQVRGSSVPWSRSDRETAGRLRAELSRIAGAHAVEMERARLELLAALGHDLRDPLHSISMAAQILQRQHSGGAELGARIEHSSGRMSRLVTQILDMARLQSKNGIDVKRETFDLVALLRETVDETMFAHPGSEVTIAAPQALMVLADRDRLVQVVGNLLSNARHHGTLGTAIQVFARTQNGRALLGVSNRGKEIPLAQRQGIFKPFKRESAQNPRNRTGLGLGLYIASEIVKAHDGELTLACEDGWTTFTADVALADEGRAGPAESG